jgi:hypothetical protein
MAGASRYLKNALLNYTLRATAFPTPAKYLALFTVAPDFDLGTGGTECSGGSYARVLIANSEFTASTLAASETNVDKTFSPNPSVAWGTVVAWGLYDALTVGNFLGGALQTPNKAINIADIVRVLAGDIDITLT